MFPGLRETGKLSGSEASFSGAYFCFYLCVSMLFSDSSDLFFSAYSSVYPGPSMLALWPHQAVAREGRGH